MRKKVTIIAIASASAEFYSQQLYQLFGTEIHVTTYSMEEGKVGEMPEADLYLIATTSSELFEYVLSLVPYRDRVVVAGITFTKEAIVPLKKYLKGTRAMLVNLSANMAVESIADLNRLGVTNIQFIPVYPDMPKEQIPELDLAITPGESRFVPRNAQKIVDIGSRVLNANTIIETALKLGFKEFPVSEECRNYINSLAEQDYSIDVLANENLNMKNRAEILVEALELGIIGVDETGIIFIMNRAAELISGRQRERVIHKFWSEALPIIGTMVTEEEMQQKTSKLIHLKDVPVNMSTAPIIVEESYRGSYILLQRFNDEEVKQQNFRLQMLERGHKTKYTFDDIVGQCPAIVKAKNIAKKMANTDVSILLTGESGTGKELFAHSIHHASKRKDMPFVAINCAALPETLLESELFGYGEGAFTGAKKGGKIGVFEYAHRGTLFLDEIEGMSPNLQVKLLRVLQEKEVMRVGENRIICVDVRIIAATNENIRDMVKAGTFRKDLYYRLNTFPIEIPPLRDRGDDIFLIMENMKAKMKADFELAEETKKIFRKYEWDGNIRELGNIVEYLKYMETPVITCESLPEVMILNTGIHCLNTEIEQDIIERYQEISKGRTELYDSVLKIFLEAEGGIGRNRIAEMARTEGIVLTEQEVRGILNVLSKAGFLAVSKGRGGSRLTRLGRELCIQIFKMGDK